MKYSDISMSRNHAVISFENGKWLLQDSDSKFGTLVLVKQRMPLLADCPKSVQIGRTLVKLSVVSKQ